ncbi:MAG TPA: glutamate formimidoyltransferase [candidate division WOR-3 bacterium]|uniref:Formimidoyltransferase-cyclodeaminase n=1 Tax=candidate division WOR-3 bacterium TaxID=2052148 RepID=A0A7V0T6Q4_UNCW3|nr:glutamate formimidoyltransferase [candidate division WOR-3 bacterium]
MRRLVECIPNFSDGRRPEVIEKIVGAIKAVQGVTMLDNEMDADHNRAVVSFVGDPEAVLEAAFRGVKQASTLIDLTKHEGEHPRMGATDVVPFVPIAGVKTEECIELARRLGKRIADELAIPTYLYELAATRPDRTDLAIIRRGEFEGLRTAIKNDPERAPDFGRPELHPTAGATVVGVRAPLVAYNVYLATRDLRVAQRIAKAVRSRSGGYAHCKALGFEIKERGCVQVSMNMTDYTRTPLYRVFETVRREAARWGVGVIESEIVGLVPQGALNACSRFYLQLNNFKRDQILENRLAATSDTGLADFLNELASSSPAPGGGSVAALNGALGAALLTMVAKLTVGKKGYEEFEAPLAEARDRFITARENFQVLIEEDADSFKAVMAAYKLPKQSEAERQKRSEAVSAALKNAAETPYRTMELALEALRGTRPVVEHGNRNSVSDAGVAVMNLDSAFRGARLNVLINLAGIEDAQFVAGKREAADEMAAEVEALVREYQATVARRMEK